MQTTSLTITCGVASRRAVIKRRLRDKKVVRRKRGRRSVEGAVPSSTFIVTYRRNLCSQVLIGAGAQGVAICEDSSGETVALSQIGPSVVWLNGKIEFRALGLQCEPLLCGVVCTSTKCER